TICQAGLLCKSRTYGRAAMMHRPRRVRTSPCQREEAIETAPSPWRAMPPPLFGDGKAHEEESASRPGQCGRIRARALEGLDEAAELGLKSILLFPAIGDSLKTQDAKESFNPKGLLPRAIREINKNFPELLVFSDVALDPYSSDGHDGILIDGKVENELTV